MKRKLCFFVNSLYGGGAEKVMQTMLGHLDYNKFDVTLYSIHQEKLNDLYPSNITYKYVYGNGRVGNYIKSFVYTHFSPSLFYRLFIKGEYDVEVAFIEGYATRIVSGSTNEKSRKIAWIHTDLKNNHWTKIAYKSMAEECECYQQFDDVVSVSETVRKSAKDLFPKIKHSLCLYNPIDSKEIILKSRGDDEITG